MNEVTIISEEHDMSTNKVIGYINFLEGKVHRLNEETGVSDISIKIDNDSFSTCVTSDNNKVYLNKTNNFYRRGLFNFNISLPNSLKELEGFDRFFAKENSLTNAFLFRSSGFTGNYIEEMENNKLLNLLTAKQTGLLIPPTIVTTNKVEALDFVKSNTEVITKPIHNGHINFSTETTTITSTGTRLVSIADIEQLEDNFVPMLMQARIEKKLEIRTFFFDGKFYSMAIFSQNDEQTSLDYRNYNVEKPNRAVPFKIPLPIETKLKKMLKKLNLNTGSIDIILTPTYEYVFLEINPTGQFDWVSQNCNYYLEEIIAKTLIRKNGKKDKIIN
jgi:ATP-GRASP peptide maturase of grasp-with-spasm system